MKNRRIGQFVGKLANRVENSQFVGTVHTDSRIRRIGYFGLTDRYTHLQRKIILSVLNFSS
jgi:hypothetical protein